MSKYPQYYPEQFDTIVALVKEDKTEEAMDAWDNIVQSIAEDVGEEQCGQRDEC